MVEIVILFFVYVYLMIKFYFICFIFIQEVDDLEESDFWFFKKYYYYFWDLYEIVFMMLEFVYNVDKYVRIYFFVIFVVLNFIYWIVYVLDKVIF